MKKNKLATGFYDDVCYIYDNKITVICWLVSKNCKYVAGNSTGLILVINPTFLLSAW